VRESSSVGVQKRKKNLASSGNKTASSKIVKLRNTLRGKGVGRDATMRAVASTGLYDVMSSEEEIDDVAKFSDAIEGARIKADESTLIFDSPGTHSIPRVDMRQTNG
jgi:hypothetical protein